MNAKKAKAIRRYAENKGDGLPPEKQAKLFRKMKDQYTKSNRISKSKHS